MEGFSIRLATVEDVPAVHRLLVELAGALGKADGIKGGEQELRRFGFSGHPHFETMLAFDGDEAVGLAVFFYEYSTWWGMPGVYVQDLYVSDELRGRGLGRILLEAVREHARGWGGRYVKLTVHHRNPAALEFYRHLGFESCDEELPLIWRD